MNLQDEKIQNIISETVERSGFFLIDLIFRGTSADRIIEIYIDGEQNVSADVCANISREINSQLEELIKTSYRLDVSSPGVDRPLKILKQYPKHINRKFEVSYTEFDPVNPDSSVSKKLSGKLISVEGEDLIFRINNQLDKKINFNHIKKAKVIVSFS